MLIRIITLELIEYPDDLRALVMADVSQNDVPPFRLANAKGKQAYLGLADALGKRRNDG
jgi:hypothetical protein